MVPAHTSTRRSTDNEKVDSGDRKTSSYCVEDDDQQENTRLMPNDPVTNDKDDGMNIFETALDSAPNT